MKPTLLSLSLLMVSSPESGPTLTGRQIAERVHEMNVRGYGGERAITAMSLHDASGREIVTYKLNTLSKESVGQGAEAPPTRTLIRFLGPPDTKGTALLTLEKDGKDADRWLYLSETRQVKRIAGSDKSAAFKGSEFAYEDMVSDTLDKYDYSLLGETKLDGRPVFVVEMRPKFVDSGYSRIVSAIDRQRFSVWQSKFYDRSGALLKIGTLADQRKVGGRWRSHLIEMRNVQTKRRTVSRVLELVQNLELSESLFTVSQLQKE